jgi:hypothetical protein
LLVAVGADAKVRQLQVALVVAEMLVLMEATELQELQIQVVVEVGAGVLVREEMVLQAVKV